MKKLLNLIVLSVFALTAKAQIEKDPTHWAYGLKKISNGVYEVHIRCELDNPWHIYAQKQGKGFVGTPTLIKFNKNAEVTLIGEPLEQGKRVTYTNPGLGIVNQEYTGMVDFVQKVRLKDGVKGIKGTITYQTCTDTHCLPPNDVEFIVPVTN